MSSSAQSSRGDPEDGDNDRIPSIRPSVSGRRAEQSRGSRGNVSTSKLHLLGTNLSCASDIQCRQQAQLLALFERIGGLGTWEIDVAPQTLTFSDNLCKLLGYPPGAHFKPDDYWSMVHPVDRDEARQIATLALHAHAPYEYAARIYATDRSVHWHIISAMPFTGDSGKLERIIGVYRDITDEARADDEMRKLSQQLMHARDAERRHMARELHESAGQTLAALKMNLARLAEELPGNCEKGRELVRSSRELADSAVREVRTISYLMHPPMLDEAGLNSALRWFARGFSERSKIRVDVDIAEDFGRQPQEIETTIFRVVQEALTNVHRYSGSRTASIRLRRDPESICVEIQDAGCGIQFTGSSGQLQISPGVGIAAMRERITELEGTFQIESAPGRGSTIRTVLPVIASHNASGANSARDRVEHLS
jgi:PAS domain S-box-containing protein